MAIQDYALTSNAEEAEVEWFYEDLQDLLELTPKKDVLFIIRDRTEKVGSQETPGVTGKFGLGMWNEAGQRLMEFCQKNALVIVNPNTQLYLIKDVHFIVNCNTEKLDNIQIPISRRLFKYIMMLL